MRALVRYINGDSSAASSPSQGEAVVPAPTTDGRAAESSNVVDLPPIPSADHTLRRSGPPRYDGIPTANLPTHQQINCCLLYTSPSPRDGLLSRMPSSA